MCETIEKEIFSRLDDWRHLPKYQLERRADIFFAIYLKEILNKCLEDKPTINLIIPEFPMWENKDNYSSWNIDYLCLSNNKAYFIELKTDIKSIADSKSSKKQLARMEKININEKKFSYYMKKLKELTTQNNIKKGKRTRLRLEWRKYVHIFELFDDVYKKEIKELIKNNSKQVNRTLVNKYIESRDFNDYDYEVECIYIVPQTSDKISDKITQITFEKISKKFNNDDFNKDAFLQRFIDSLGTWKDPVY